MTGDDLARQDLAKTIRPGNRVKIHEEHQGSDLGIVLSPTGSGDHLVGLSWHRILNDLLLNESHGGISNCGKERWTLDPPVDGEMEAILTTTLDDKLESLGPRPRVSNTARVEPRDVVDRVVRSELHGNVPICA
jgi:hypothetical protein